MVNFLKGIILKNMSILKISKLGHPVLLKKAEVVKDFSDKSIKKIVYDMSETMIDYNGIGLAAPQVHISKRIIIFRNPDLDNKEKIQISPLINPSYKNLSEETDNQWEGCLSIPGMQGLVKRYKKIRYYGFDLDGKKIENEAEGLHARVVQHEIDHLDGILYTSKLAHKGAFGFEKEIIEYWKNEQK